MALAAYNAWQQNLTAIKNEIISKINANTNLSIDAKALLNLIVTIESNNSYSYQQACEGVEKAVNDSTEAVRNELDIPERMRSGGNFTGGHRGGGPWGSRGPNGTLVMTPPPFVTGANQTAGWKKPMGGGGGMEGMCLHGGWFGGEAGYQRKGRGRNSTDGEMEDHVRNMGQEMARRGGWQN